MSKDLYQSAIDYHMFPTPGKLAIQATKPLANQRDLALAYSPGVAAACHEIVADPKRVADLTARSNLVAVITNGTAVLGLGNIGPLAAKPVMEGKAVLFKKFAGVDVFDIEIDEKDPEKLVDIIRSLEPTFGGINLEDIKAPECFEVEKRLRESLSIPVFHDDQHGTAIIVGAAVINGLKLVNKKIEDVKLVCSGAGAAAIACLDLLMALGLRQENIYVCDGKGMIYQGRGDIKTCNKSRFAQDTQYRTLSDCLENADIFLGVSVANVLNPDDLHKLAPRPLILALANPNPEIDPQLAKKARPDAILATGRSDYPNQVNNVLCFPYIFRGALDVGATTINMEMKMGCVHALARLAQAEASDVVTSAYGGEETRFGEDYIIPKPFDPRLITELAPAVARAAMETGVATRPIEDFKAYRDQLYNFVFRSSMVMRPLFMKAKEKLMRVAYSEGEEERVLRSVQVIIDEELARPILIGRPDVIAHRIARMGLRLVPEKDFDIVNPEDDHRYRDYWQNYYQIMQRQGITPDAAKRAVRTDNSVIAALMVLRNDADAMLVGPVGRFNRHLEAITPILGHQQGASVVAALSAIVTDNGTYFFCDPYVNLDPTPEQLAEMTILAGDAVRSFGITPKVALLSHSSYGTTQNPTALKMQKTLTLLRQQAPDLEVDGEMHGDAALNAEVREKVFPNSILKGCANLLIMPTLDAANIAFNLAKEIGAGQSIGPIVLGLGRSGHILTPSVSVRGIVNMTAFAVYEAQQEKKLVKN